MVNRVLFSSGIRAGARLNPAARPGVLACARSMRTGFALCSGSLSALLGLAFILTFAWQGLLSPALAQNAPPRPVNSALSDPLAPPRADPLRVACDQALWPFSFKNDSEQTGFELELWEKLAAGMAVEYEMIPMPFEQIIEALEKGEIDLSVAVIPVTKARQERVSFSLPYYRIGLAGLCRQEEAALPDEPAVGRGSDKKKQKAPGKFDAFNDKTVAVQQGSAAESFALEYLQESRLRTYAYQEEMFFDLLAHTVDIVFAELTTLEAYLNVTGNPELALCTPVFEKHNLAIALPKNSPHLKEVNRQIQNLRQSSEFKELCLKWFGTVPELGR